MSDQFTEDSSSYRKRRPWWFDSSWKALAVVYLPQLVVLVAGPLTECGHCVGIFFKFYLIVPGFLLGEFSYDYMPVDTPDWINLAMMGLMTAIVLFSVLMIGGWLKGWKRWLFYLVIAILFGFNALYLSADLRG